MALICQRMEPLMPAMPFSDTARSRPAETMAVLGLLSGFLSAVWGQTYDLEALQPLAIVFLLAPRPADRILLRCSSGHRHGGVGPQAVGGDHRSRHDHVCLERGGSHGSPAAAQLR